MPSGDPRGTCCNGGCVLFRHRDLVTRRQLTAMISSLLASFALPSCFGVAPKGEKANSSRPEKRMKPRITMLTLGVDDLERSVKFYRDGLGFPTEGIVGKEFEHGAVAFFDLQVGLKLVLFARS